MDSAIAAVAFDLQAAVDGTEPDLVAAIVPAVAKGIKQDAKQLYVDTVNRSQVFAVLRQSGLVISRACALDTSHFMTSAHSLRGANHELPALSKGEVFHVVIDSVAYQAKALEVPVPHACPVTGFTDGVVYMSLDSAFAPATKLTKDSRGTGLTPTSPSRFPMGVIATTCCTPSLVPVSQAILEVHALCCFLPMPRRMPSIWVSFLDNMLWPPP